MRACSSVGMRTEPCYTPWPSHVSRRGLSEGEQGAPGHNTPPFPETPLGLEQDLWLFEGRGVRGRFSASPLSAEMGVPAMVQRKQI